MALKPKDAPDLGRFDWEDPFRMDEQLTEEERAIRDAARAYAQDKLQPRVIDAYRDEQTDPAIFREMGETGLLGDEIDVVPVDSHVYPARNVKPPAVTACEVRKASDDVADLAGEVGDVVGEVPDLDHEVRDPAREVPHLGDQVPHLEHEVPDLEREVPELEHEVPELEREAPDLVNEVPDVIDEVRASF